MTSPTGANKRKMTNKNTSQKNEGGKPEEKKKKAERSVLTGEVTD